MNDEGITQIGNIINSHGRKGEVKVYPLTNDSQIFYQKNLIIMIDDDKRIGVTVTHARPFKDLWLLKFNEIDTIEASKKLKGKGIYIEDHLLKPLEEDEFFVHDLVNSRVYSVEGRYLGIVTDYFEAGDQGVCEVTENESTFLFPATREVLKEIIPPDKIVIKLLPGLVELNR